MFLYDMQYLCIWKLFHNESVLKREPEYHVMVINLLEMHE